MTKSIPSDAPTEERGFGALRAFADSDLESAVESAEVPAADVAPPVDVVDPSQLVRAMVEAALRRATTARDRRRVLRDTRPCAVVIRVPSPAWVDNVAEYLTRFEQRRWLVIARSGAKKLEHLPSVGNSKVVIALSEGRSVVGISIDPDGHLPRVLTAAADVRIEVSALDAEIVGAAMRTRFPATEVGTIPPEAVVALDFDDVVAAMRPGVTAQDAIALLGRASQRRTAGDDTSKAPNLDTAVEYGPAREFGLALAQDIRLYSEGQLAWADAMKGGIFWGDAGTGKTLLAASIAARAGVPLLKFSVGALFGKDSHLGTVIDRLRDAMSQSAAMAPCIALWDEIEAIPRRDELDTRGRDWWLPIIDLMLLLTDAGISPGQNAGRPAGVFLLGATNHLELVEPALLRPNRFERAIEITRPDAAGIENIMRFHLGDALVDADITGLAHSIEGSTAAEVMAVVRAARRTARIAGRPMELADLETGALGDEERSAELDWRIAVHESAHAVAAIVSGSGRLVYVTIRGREDSGGHAAIDAAQDDLATRETIESSAVRILAAGAAETLIVGSLSVGWAVQDDSDLGRVSALIASLHASSGLAGNFFLRAGDTRQALAAVRADPELRRAVEADIRRLHARASALVERHRDRIVAVAHALIERRHLDAAAVVEIVSAIQQNDEKQTAAAPVLRVALHDQT